MYQKTHTNNIIIGMKINLNEKDRLNFKKLLELKDKNINISDMLLTAFCYVDFLNKDQIVSSNNEEEAIIQNIKENFSEDNDIDDLESYVSIKCLNESDYITDYANKLSNINAKYKNYQFKTVNYEPYQLFAYDDIEIDGYKEISKVGYFKNRFAYLSLSEGNNMWMSLNPNEITTMSPFIKDAKGNVLVLGLGMGYIQYMMSKKSDISSITIVEKNHDNIVFFNKFIYPIFDKKKIKIVEDDAVKFVEQFHRYDYIFADLWFTPEDGIEYYLKLNKIENKYKIKIHYWLEASLKQMKKRYLIELINEAINGANDQNYVSKETLEDRIFRELYLETKNITISSLDDIKELIKWDLLRKFSLLGMVQAVHTQWLLQKHAIMY